MTLKRLYILLVFSLLIICCAFPKLVNDKAFAPPNHIRVSENLWVDKTEISNQTYLLYMSWLSSMFGENSKQHFASPDTSIIICDKLGMPYLDYISNYPKHPVVGISLAQATTYTYWRTDRVAEKALYLKGILEVGNHKTKDTYFTIKKYKNREIELKKNAVYEDIEVAVFRMPSHEDWLEINNSDLVQECLNVKSEMEIDSSDFSLQRKPCLIDRKKENTIFHLIGNVSEMVTTGGESRGGSWMHTLVQSNPDSIQRYEAPNCWTGFRNVASIEKIEVVKLDSSSLN